MRFYAIDPGYTQSAWILMDDRWPLRFGIDTNENVIELVRQREAPLVVEMIASYGMPVGREVFETCLWIGRFIEAAKGVHTKIYRKDVKMTLCNSTRAKDANVRQALIDRYGPGKERAVGVKARPGPLYGFKADLWAALGVGVTYLEQETQRETAQ